MSSLIIAIISIALIAAVALATMSYVGDSLTQGRTKADAAAFVSGAQQIAGAVAMYNASTGLAAADVATLVTDKYLSAAPKVQGVELALATADRQVTADISTVKSSVDDLCKALNISAGATGDGAPVADTLPDGQAYGCVTKTAKQTFVFAY